MTGNALKAFEPQGLECSNHSASAVRKYIRNPNCSCLVCGKSIYRRPNQLQLSNGKAYCTHACYVKTLEILKTCPICDAKFKSGKNSKTCSRSCSNKNRSGMLYKGRSPTKSKVTTYKAILNRVVALLGYKCCRCSYDKMPILNMHHMVERHDGGSDDLDNLLLLCPNCHSEEHYIRRKAKREALTIASQEKHKARKKMSEAAPLIHGTRRAYNDKSCRCAECRLWRSMENTKYKLARSSRKTI